MSLERTLAQNAASAVIATNTIGDGRVEYAYAEIPGLLEQIRDHLTACGVELGAASVAVECRNSASAALLLLALMRYGASFLVFPPSSTASDLKPTPHFCRHRLTVAAATPDFDRSRPASLIHAEANPDYNGKAAEPGRLYLRTSGSMGASKIVVHTHAKLIGNARNCVEKYGFSAASRAAIPVPIAHMYGFGAELLPAVLAGSSIDLQDSTNLLKYLDREKKFRPNIAFTTPALCDMLLKGYRSPRTNYDVFVTSGQRVSEELFRAFDPMVGGRLVNQYGSSEMGATAACNPGEPLDRRARTIGEPMAGVELRIEPVAESDAAENGAAQSGGQLLCRHPFGFEGYMNEDGDWLSQAAADGWYATGDLAATGADESISVLGRADASVNRSGYLVRLYEIERILEIIEGVGEVAVVAGSGEASRGQRIAAFCVPRPGTALDAAQIQRRCGGVLPPYAIPDDIQVMEALPRLATGKIDRRALMAMTAPSPN